MQRLLNRRVGELDSSLQTQIQALSLTQLEALSEALLDFVAVADVVAWLEHKASSIPQTPDC